MLLFSRVGIAREILTDQGSCFMSRVLKGLLSLLQVRQLQTLVYHPQTNGLVERFNKTLKQMLRRSWTSMGRTGTSSCPTCCSPFAKYPKHRQAFPPSNFCTGEGQGDSSTSPRRPRRVNPPPIAQWWTTLNRYETAWPGFGPSSENISNRPNWLRPESTTGEPSYANTDRETWSWSLYPRRSVSSWPSGRDPTRWSTGSEK